jgi:hypothetical protein
MAIIKQCDRCKTIVGVDAMISINRKRKCRNQHDGQYLASIQADYDLCEKCAREIELLFISVEKADEVIMT